MISDIPIFTHRLRLLDRTVANQTPAKVPDRMNMAQKTNDIRQPISPYSSMAKNELAANDTIELMRYLGKGTLHKANSHATINTAKDMTSVVPVTKTITSATAPKPVGIPKAITVHKPAKTSQFPVITMIEA